MWLAGQLMDCLHRLVLDWTDSKFVLTCDVLVQDLVYGCVRRPVSVNSVGSNFGVCFVEVFVGFSCSVDIAEVPS